MADNFPDLDIVAPLLRMATFVTECRVDCFQVSVRAGESLYLDILDEEFPGEINRDKLLSTLVRGIRACARHDVIDGGPGVSEGATIGIAIERLIDDQFSLKLALGVGL